MIQGSFALDVSKFAVKTGVALDAVARRVAFEVGNGVVLKTPVDTGRARANWIPCVGSIPKGIVALTDKTGGGARSAMQSAVKEFGSGKIIYFANNLPYIQRLEDGWSKQAPAGMVHLTLLEVVTKFNSIVKGSVTDGTA